MECNISGFIFSQCANVYVYYHASRSESYILIQPIWYRSKFIGRSARISKQCGPHTTQNRSPNSTQAANSCHSSCIKSCRRLSRSGGSIYHRVFRLSRASVEDTACRLHLSL